MTAALVVSLVAQFAVGLSADDPRQFAWLLLVTTAATTVVWLAVTFATPAEPPDRLRAFYARVRPGGPGWRAVVPGAVAEGALASGLVQWVIGCVVVYLGLFGIGTMVLGRPLRGAVAVVVGALLAGYLWRASSGPVEASGRSQPRVVS